MPDFVDNPTKKFPLITRVFIFLYIALFLFSTSLPFFYQQLPIVSSMGLERTIVLIPSFLLAFYFLIIAFSFWRTGDNWLIFSIVLIFFSSLGAILLAILGSLNAKSLLSKGLPSCVNDLVNCNRDDGIVVLSAILLGISIPAIVFNILTFVGIMKSFGARDPYE